MAIGASALDAKTTGGSSKVGRIGVPVFGEALIIGFIYAGSHLTSDLSVMHSPEPAPGLPLF